MTCKKQELEQKKNNLANNFTRVFSEEQLRVKFGIEKPYGEKQGKNKVRSGYKVATKRKKQILKENQEICEHCGKPISEHKFKKSYVKELKKIMKEKKNG